MTAPRTRQLTRPAVQYLVYHAHKGAALKVSDQLDAVTSHEALAPNVSTAKFRVRNPQGTAWRNKISFDDTVVITPSAPTGTSTDIFSGQIIDTNWDIARDDTVTVTAVGNAHRLRVDLQYKIFGRYMPGVESGVLINATLLPCEFNAGGKPNMYRELVRVNDPGELGDVAQSEATKYVDNTFGGLPVFTDDDNPFAQYWCLRDALVYLMWLYNPSEAHVKNFAAKSMLQTDVLPAVNVNGMGLWEAIAALCEAAGYDAYEKFTYSAAEGKIISTIAIVQRHAGTVRSVKRQATGSIDLNKTNLFSASIAESITSCQTAVQVYGGRDLYEVTVPLYGVWQSTLEVPTGSYVVLPVNNNTPNIESEEYSMRYVTGGSKFCDYADAGRIWDANTDNLYAVAPYYCETPDMSDLAGQGKGHWPVMRYQPLPMLSGTQDANWQIRSLESFLEVSFDAGETWQPVKGYDVMPDRIGVRLTAENLAGIIKKDGDPVTENLFYALATNASTVQMRLTVTVASPKKLGVDARRGATARGTKYDCGNIIDRGDLYILRTRSGVSRFAKDSKIPVDETNYDPAKKIKDAVAAETRFGYRTAYAGLIKLGNDIISAMGGKFIEGSLPIEWPDYNVQLTDCISSIDGLNVSLSTTMGQSGRYPRVIMIERHYLPQQYQTILTLDTTRKAAVI